MNSPSQLRDQHGTTMMEVLVTLVILAFGLIGLAGLQSKTQLGSIESFQRAQAIVLLSDMEQRISTSNTTDVPSFVTTGTIGTDDSQPADCTAVTAGPERHKCEWSNALKGAAEKKSDSTNIGGMTGARGCITQLQAPDSTAGVCKPGIYQVSVSWQGMHETVSPTTSQNNTCGEGSYGTDTYRRTISRRITISLLSC